MLKKLTCVVIGLFLLLIGGLSYVAAEDFPDRPIEVVDPFTAGGNYDFQFSLFKDRVSKVLGQPMIMVYKVGAAGALGMASVAKAKPDGYTLVFSSTTLSVAYPYVNEGIKYTTDSFAPVVQIAKLPNYFFVQDDSPYKSLREFMEAAKTKKLTYATYGTRSAGNFIMEILCKEAGVKITHIPYPGGAPAFTACLGGHVTMAIGGTLGSVVKPGMLRPIAIAADERSSVYPEAKTLREQGYTVSYNSSSHILAPAGTPKERIDKIYKAFKTVRDKDGDELAKLFRGGDIELDVRSPEDLTKMLLSDCKSVKRWVEETDLLKKK